MTINLIAGLVFATTWWWWDSLPATYLPQVGAEGMRSLFRLRVATGIPAIAFLAALFVPQWRPCLAGRYSWLVLLVRAPSTAERSPLCSLTAR